VPDLLHGADLFCHPALREGFGYAIAEAMAAGKPVMVITEHWSGQSPMPDTPDNRPGRWENFRSVVVDLSNGDYPELWEEVMAEYDGDDEDLRKEVKMMQKWIEPYRNMYLPI
jgi:glycosyltransferase involved in cell wall biosynthesis